LNRCAAWASISNGSSSSASRSKRSATQVVYNNRLHGGLDRAGLETRRSGELVRSEDSSPYASTRELMSRMGQAARVQRSSTSTRPRSATAASPRLSTPCWWVTVRPRGTVRAQTQRDVAGPRRNECRPRLRRCACDLGLCSGAGEGNRTPTVSLGSRPMGRFRAWRAGLQAPMRTVCRCPLLHAGCTSVVDPSDRSRRVRAAGCVRAAPRSGGVVRLIDYGAGCAPVAVRVAVISAPSVYSAIGRQTFSGVVARPLGEASCGDRPCRPGRARRSLVHCVSSAIRGGVSSGWTDG
jgi:hypothetical protein